MVTTVITSTSFASYIKKYFYGIVAESISSVQNSVCCFFLMSYVQHITTYDVDEVFCGFHFRIFDGRQ